MDRRRQREALPLAASNQLQPRVSRGDEAGSPGRGRVLGRRTCAHAQRSPGWKSLCSATVSAPSQMLGLCRGSTRLLTRNFGLCTLELVKFLEKPARLEHGSLHRQNLVLSHRGTCWDKCKCPNSDLHRLKTQARRGSIGRATQRREGCQMTHEAMGMVLCALLRRPRGAGWGTGRRQGSPSSARAVSGCT